MPNKKENKLVLYKDDEGKLSVNTLFADEDVWLTQAQLAEIYQTTQQNVSLHLQGIYEDKELDDESTHKKFLLVRQEGKRQVKREIEHDKRFFYFKKDGTGHAFEGFVSYDFGPVAASWQTIFAGNDYQESNDKRTYSSYFQLQAPFRLATCDWEATAGLVPWASDYYSTNGFSVTCLSLRATKDIKITDSFSLPLFGQRIANPASQGMYFVAGFTLKAF